MAGETTTINLKIVARSRADILTTPMDDPYYRPSHSERRREKEKGRERERERKATTMVATKWKQPCVCVCVFLTVCVCECVSVCFVCVCVRVNCHPTLVVATNTRWGEPNVLYSKGAKEIDNMSMPRTAFTNQTLDCDFNPKITNANARQRRILSRTPIKPVPFSVIINCSPEDDIIRGSGLSCMETISIDESISEEYNCVH
jgi:hypothetical protein